MINSLCLNKNIRLKVNKYFKLFHNCNGKIETNLNKLVRNNQWIILQRFNDYLWKIMVNE